MPKRTLPRLTRTQARILSSLNHLRVPTTSVHIDDDADLSRGGYGEVYKARLDGFLLPVAVKELRAPGNKKQWLRVEMVSGSVHYMGPSIDTQRPPKQSFVRELRVWSEMDHPNIIPLVGFHLDSKRGVFRFISPFLGEGNVTEYLERTKADASTRFRLVSTTFLRTTILHSTRHSHGTSKVIDTAAALAYLHEQNICHGDVKSVRRAILSCFQQAYTLTCRQTR